MHFYNGSDSMLVERILLCQFADEPAPRDAQIQSLHILDKLGSGGQQQRRMVTLGFEQSDELGAQPGRFWLGFL